MGTDALAKTIDDLEKEVIEELSHEDSNGVNPNKMFDVIFPYQVSFLIHDNDENHPPTQVFISTHSQEYYSGRNEQDVRFQKEHSDQYSKEGLIKWMQKYVRDELWNLDPPDAHLTYTGEPEIREMNKEELKTLKIGRGNDD